MPMMRNNKTIRRYGAFARTQAIMLCLCVMLSACTAGPSGSSGPIAAAQEDTATVDREGVVVYFVEANSGRVGYEVSSVLLPKDESLAETVAALCLRGPTSTNQYIRLFPNTVSALSCRVVQGVATLDISSELLALSDQQLFYAKMCLVNSLCELPDVQYVRIIVDGKESQRAFLGEPVSKYDGNFEVLWLEKSRENEREAYEKQNVTLYFADRQKNFLLSEVHEISFDPLNKAMTIVQELVRGTRDRTALTAALPEGMTVSEVLYEEIRDDAGSDDEKKVLVSAQPVDELGQLAQSNVVIRLSQTVHAFSRGEFEKDTIAIGSLVMSVLENMPAVQGVRIEVNKEVIRNVNGDGINNDDTLFTKERFLPRLGTSVAMYYPDVEMEMLRRIYRAMPYRDVYSPEKRVRSLLSGPSMMEQQRYGVINPFAEGLTSADVAWVIPLNRTLYINCSGDMIASLTGGSVDRQILMTYAIVNTLTEMTQYKAVQFVQTGRLPKSEEAHLSLEHALIRNPGLIWSGEP